MVTRLLPLPNGTVSCFIGRGAALLVGGDVGALGCVELGLGARSVVVVVDCVGVVLDGRAAGGCVAPLDETTSTETAASVTAVIAPRAVRRQVSLPARTSATRTSS
jgi:hypothetical protein